VIASLALAQADVALQSAGAARLHVFGDLYLADPWFLAAIPIGLALVMWGRARRGRAAGRVPTLPPTALPASMRQRLAWVPAALQAIALCAVALALSRPVRANELRTTTSEGVDIALVVDRSSSMKYTDLDGEHSRLEIVKEVVGDFAVRRMTDTVGASDNCALVVFAQFPQLLCPFTLDAGALTGFLKNVEIVRNEAEDGTAIGRGLGKAVALLEKSDARSKVAVLLTDGENNVDDIQPLEVADLAAELGVKVYTVLAGRYVIQEDIFGRVFATEHEIDSRELEQIAQRTGGRFFRARDRETLERVYAEIESLERTPRQERRYAETFDLYPLLVLAGLCAYALAWFSSSTWARRLP
jgi:Ca-activated chloride channel family protein